MPFFNFIEIDMPPKQLRSSSTQQTSKGITDKDFFRRIKGKLDNSLHTDYINIINIIEKNFNIFLTQIPKEDEDAFKKISPLAQHKKERIHPCCKWIDSFIKKIERGILEVPNSLFWETTTKEPVKIVIDYKLSDFFHDKNDVVTNLLENIYSSKIKDLSFPKKGTLFHTAWISFLNNLNKELQNIEIDGKKPYSAETLSTWLNSEIPVAEFKEESSKSTLTDTQLLQTIAEEGEPLKFNDLDTNNQPEQNDAGTDQPPSNTSGESEQVEVAAEPESLLTNSHNSESSSIPVDPAVNEPRISQSDSSTSRQGEQQDKDEVAQAQASSTSVLNVVTPKMEVSESKQTEQPPLTSNAGDNYDDPITNWKLTTQARFLECCKALPESEQTNHKDDLTNLKIHVNTLATSTNPNDIYTARKELSKLCNKLTSYSCFEKVLMCVLGLIAISLLAITCLTIIAITKPELLTYAFDALHMLDNPIATTIIDTAANIASSDLLTTAGISSGVVGVGLLAYMSMFKRVTVPKIEQAAYCAKEILGGPSPKII